MHRGDGSVTITYTLKGINSGIMDAEQATGIEKLLAKLGMYAGDLFLSAFRYCTRWGNYRCTSI